MRVSPTEITEGWSERDVNLMLLFYQARTIAREPNDRDFYERIAELIAAEM